VVGYTWLYSSASVDVETGEGRWDIQFGRPPAGLPGRLSFTVKAACPFQCGYRRIDDLGRFVPAEEIANLLTGKTIRLINSPATRRSKASHMFRRASPPRLTSWPTR